MRLIRCSAAAPHANGASIILTGSTASFRILEAHNVYAATKAAIRSFARSWTFDLKERKMRVNVLRPRLLSSTSSAGPKEFVVLEASMAAVIPLGSWVESTELAKAALFLASDDSGLVTGIELCVDGGMSQI